MSSAGLTSAAQQHMQGVKAVLRASCASACQPVSEPMALPLPNMAAAPFPSSSSDHTRSTASASLCTMDCVSLCVAVPAVAMLVCCAAGPRRLGDMPAVFAADASLAATLGVFSCSANESPAAVAQSMHRTACLWLHVGGLHCACVIKAQ